MEPKLKTPTLTVPVGTRISVEEYELVKDLRRDGYTLRQIVSAGIETLQKEVDKD